MQKKGVVEKLYNFDYFNKWIYGVL